MRHVEGLSVGAQQNKIYIFEGPHGSGKSTFLYNLLRKFEEYANTPEGRRYEVVWRLKRDQAVNAPQSLASLTERLAWLLENKGLNNDRNHPNAKEGCADDNDPGAYFDVPCPSHDNPFLIIPKDVRRRFLTNCSKMTSSSGTCSPRRNMNGCSRNRPARSVPPYFRTC